MDTEPEDRLERRRDELRRIVYGTRGGVPEDDAAELAAVEQELAERDQSRGRQGRGVRRR